MTGIKVTMMRVDHTGVKPVERLFENADSWFFGFDRSISTLHIVRTITPDDKGGSTRTTIAEFPSAHVESVENA